jgi:ribonuclease M5
MKEIKEIIVVEGKTDTAVLQELFIVETIETKGLQLSKETLELIVQANKKRGIIVLTDPDFPGRKIRDQIMQVIPDCKHAFINKKDAIGKKKVGVAEARKEAIIEALENSVSFFASNESITWVEFLSLDIIGDRNKRIQVYEAFHLGYGNVKTLFKRLNMIGITKKQIIDVVGE